MNKNIQAVRNADLQGFKMPNLRKSKEAASAIEAMDAFFAEHDFTEQEKNLFFNAAIFCAACALDGEDEPIMQLNLLDYICRDRAVTTQDIGKHIEGFITILKAMAHEAEWKGKIATN